MRVARLKDGTIAAGAAFGRGAYICPKDECLEGALAKERLARALRMRIDGAKLEAIRNDLWDKLR